MGFVYASYRVVSVVSATRHSLRNFHGHASALINTGFATMTDLSLPKQDLKYTSRFMNLTIPISQLVNITVDSRTALIMYPSWLLLTLALCYFLSPAVRDVWSESPEERHSL